MRYIYSVHVIFLVAVELVQARCTVKGFPLILEKSVNAK